MYGTWFEIILHEALHLFEWLLDYVVFGLVLKSNLGIERVMNYEWFGVRHMNVNMNINLELKLFFEQGLKCNNVEM